MTIKADGFIKLIDCFILSPGKQHDLVAVATPGITESSSQHILPISFPPIVRVCHDILNDTVRSATSREVSNDAKCT